MADIDLDQARRIVGVTRGAQGLPPTVIDDLALGHVADILRLAAPTQPRRELVETTPGLDTEAS